MNESTHRQVRRILQLEQGTFLLTGPSSSGKTTTIYALLRALHEDRGEATHILTLEDPIEQALDFAGQVPIRPDQGLDWPTALRSVLRHDPNVILIGEIRDRETAEIAVQAGLTGHFVISTVHSGRAVGVLVRLVHMDVEPFLVASSVTATLAQRLVRRLCPECRVAVAPEPELQSQLGLTEEERLWTSRGCEACGSTGGQGRIGIFELLVVSPALREGVMNRRPEAALQSIGFPEGNALVADALEKARAGLIGMDELSRIAAATLVGTGDKTGS
jgi:type II secretory ATPase GspE/PulE/Tfp pilus assembly ATPase PilB-like protein